MSFIGSFSSKNSVALREWNESEFEDIIVHFPRTGLLASETAPTYEIYTLSLKPQKQKAQTKGYKRV